MADKMMLCGPIHRLPENLWVEGAIALDKDTGFFTFYRATTTPVQEIKHNLMAAGTGEDKIILFEGFKERLIGIVKPLNDAIRAKNNSLTDGQTPVFQNIACPPTA
jgi:hypothetical protein